MNLDAIVFDFDGVLAESVNVKGDAFYALYEHEGPEIQQQVLDYHLAHGGVSRFDKIRYYEGTLLDRPATEEKVEEMANRFSVLVEKKVVASDWVKGAKDFLETYYTQIPLFVASATPQEELERIVENRGMTHYFKTVFGSPTKKAVHLDFVMREHGFAKHKTFMIGDTISDYNAAQEAGTQFIGRNPPNLPSPFPEGTIVIKDLTTLSDVLTF